MKRQFLLPLVVALLPLLSLAQGWPANYGGVMLQGFYWDSYQLDYASVLDAGWSNPYWEVPRTTWSVLNSSAVKNQITPYIDLIWLPQSGATTAPAKTTITGWGQWAEQMITDENGKNKLLMKTFNNGEQYTINQPDRMGFIPVWWFDHGKGKNYSWDDTQYTSTSAFGTEAELRALIRDYKNAGTFAIEDVVINHKGAPGMWNDGSAGRPTGKDMYLIFENSSTGAPSNDNDVTWQTENPNNDIVANASQDYYSEKPYLDSNGYKISESGFTGGTWGKDLRHDSENVQNNVVKYLNFLKDDLGYAGFRYDYVKGYDPKYLAQYNIATRPTFSVGEFFDGDQAYLQSWIDKTYAEDAYQSAAFDFPLKFAINNAFNNDNGNYSYLNNAGLISNFAYRRYSVTFVDNHDTFKNIPGDNTHRGFGNRLSHHILEANMFILAMPGTPCLFYPHYMNQSWQPTIIKCIKARHAAGITNQAAISEVTPKAENDFSHLQFRITGSKGVILMQLGSTFSNAAIPSGFELVHKEGDCRMLISSSCTGWRDNETYVKETLIGGFAIIDKPSGNFTSEFDVHIGASNSATKVVYTTDGNTPDAGSATAPATLHITGNTTVKAAVVVNGVVDENSVVIRDYVMDQNDETGKIKVYISYSQYNSGYGYTEHPCIYAFKGDTKYTGDWPGWTELGYKENIAGVDWYVATIEASDFDLILHRGGSNSNLADVSKSATIKNVTHDIFLTYTDGVAHDVTAMYGSALHDPKLSIDAPSGTYEGSLKVNLNSTRDDPYVGEKKAKIVYVTWEAGETPKRCTVPPTDESAGDNDGVLWGSGEITIPATNTAGSSHYLRAAIIKDGEVIHEQARSYFLKKVSGAEPWTDATPETTGISIYVQKGNTAPYLYAWNGGTNYNGGWPGTQMSEIRKVNNVEYYYKHFTQSSDFNIIFNNGGSGTDNQTADIGPLSTGSYFYTYNGGGTSNDISQSSGNVTVNTTTTSTPLFSDQSSNLYVLCRNTANEDTAPYWHVWGGSPNDDGQSSCMSSDASITYDGHKWWYKKFTSKPSGIIFKANTGHSNNDWDNSHQSGDVTSYGSTGVYFYTWSSNQNKGTAADEVTSYGHTPTTSTSTSTRSNNYNTEQVYNPSALTEVVVSYSGLSSSVTPIEEGREGFFFENDVDFGMPFAWVYNGTTAYSGNAWPGEQLIEVVGTAANGNTIYRWTWSDDAGDAIPPAAKVIFSNNGDNTTQVPGSGQTGFGYVRNGYYTSAGSSGSVNTDQMSLSTLLSKAKKGTLDTSKDYTITNDLEVAYVSGDGYLYVRDKNSKALDYSTPTANQIVDDVLATKNYEQSNWVAIKVLTSGYDARNNFGINGQAKLLGSTIHGKFALVNGNPELHAEWGTVQFEPVFDTYQTSYSERNHVNTYFPAHFGSHMAYPGTEHAQEYFFVKPQLQEYAKLEDCVYNGGAMWMPVQIKSERQNMNGFNGGINVVINSYYWNGTLHENERYKLTGIIRHRAAASGSAPRRIGLPYIAGENTDYEFVVITAEVDNRVVTGVENVDVERTVQSVSYVDLMGRMSTRPHNGVNVVVTTYTDGTKKTTKVVF